MLEELGFVHINCPRDLEVAKIQCMELIPTQNRFFSIHTEYETEVAFSFKNSEVCSAFVINFNGYFYGYIQGGPKAQKVKQADWPYFNVE